MDTILLAFDEIFSGIPWRMLSLGLAVLLLGQFIVRLIQILLDKLIDQYPSQKRNFAYHKITIYGLNVLIILLFLKVISVDLKYILGAAGFLTLAIGFAARTSISNLISGFFLIFEKPFFVGDLIEINDVKGEVLSLDLLCVRIRTLDNLMVRVPNEMVAGAAVKNHSYFPIRRFDLEITVSHEESLTNIHKLLLKVAGGHEMALTEPEPFFSVSSFNENYILIEFKVWTSRENYFDFTTDFPKVVHRALKNSGIEHPYQKIKIVDQNPSKSEERP